MRATCRTQVIHARVTLGRLELALVALPERVRVSIYVPVSCLYVVRVRVWHSNGSSERIGRHVVFLQRRVSLFPFSDGAQEGSGADLRPARG